MGTGFAEMTAVDAVRLAERCFGGIDVDPTDARNALARDQGEALAP
jgi:hypothetical protein